MKPVPQRETVTGVAWPRTLPTYGDPETYRRAAAWLEPCAEVADWGGASGAFKAYLPDGCRYRLVDGTQQVPGQVLADLRDYREPSEGILLRHVLDNTHEWQPILRNALAAFTRRLVIVTFLPPAEVTHRKPRANGWPTWSFNPMDLRLRLGTLLHHDEVVLTTHHEHVYYAERP